MKQNFTVRQGALDGVESALSVARHRSFRRPAADLGVTPSAISQAVRALEARVGVALFIRTTRSPGIRLGQFIAPDMVVVRLTPPFPFVVVGSPDYLRRRKRPERIDDLRQHACLRMRRSNGSIAPWSFVDGNKAIQATVSGPLVAPAY